MKGPGLTEADVLSRVDPELRGAAAQMRTGMSRFAPMSLEKLAERRAWIASLGQPALSDVPVIERRIPGLAGDVTIFIVNAKPGAARPGIVHAHGGGFNASSARGSLPNLQMIAEALDCAIVTIDYRLAPETRHAGSVEDNYAGLLWTHAHAEALGIDRRRIALMGESAGGGHVALLSVKARDRGEVPVCFQMLVYPMLDDRTGSSRRVPPHIGAFGWNEDANRFGWRCFLGCAPGGRRVPREAVPARIADLSGLPPAFIGVGDLDLFVDESVQYARRLIEAGVPTELLVVPGAFHGFDSFAKDSAIGRRFVAAKLDALRRAFATVDGRR